MQSLNAPSGVFCFAIKFMIPISEQSFKKIALALALYLTSLFAANTLGLKIMPFLFGLHLSVGVFSFPIVFLMTDVIGEIYGKKVARFFVLAGFVSTGLFIAYSVISLTVPWSHDGEWVMQGYNQVFGISLRIAIASLTAFLIGEYQDVLSFFFFRTWWKARFFWLRSMLSALWSQLLDTVIFMIVAFAGVYPMNVLVNLIISWWLFKVAMGICYSPLLYVGVRLLRSGEREQTKQIA